MGINQRKAKMSMEKHILQFIQLAVIVLVFISCYLVIHPFIPAIVFAMVVCISTWPLYLCLRKALWGKPALASLLMVMLLIMLVIIPSALLAVSLADNVTATFDTVKVFLEHGPIEPPVWLKELPLFGERLNSYWQGLASGGKEAVMLFKELLEPVRNFLLNLGNVIGQSLLQMVFAAFIGFFFYRDGEALIQALRNGMAKLLAGSLGAEPLTMIHQTVTGVVHGIFGAALAQAIAATIGFFIAGVPGAFLLGAATFFLAMIPMGPTLIWGGASVWFLYQESYGWAIFMVLWGVLVISSIDNVVRPYLISRGSSLSFLLTFLGVTGGIVAYGFIGIFIGPPILAVGVMLTQLWTAHPATGIENPPEVRN
ncbi:MAG: AI-2E family transporter [Nitrosomonas sp.]|nr:AI-2E family transporter [Nitrosomonas sp.]